MNFELTNQSVALARDLAPVRVNTISPGMTRGTGAYLSMAEAAREGMYSAIAARLPVGRIGTAEDIAAATLMLMTNAFITGVTLDVMEEESLSEFGRTPSAAPNRSGRQPGRCPPTGQRQVSLYVTESHSATRTRSHVLVVPE
jgi:hypothetical protein